MCKSWQEISYLNRVAHHLGKLHQVVTMEGYVPEKKNVRRYRE